MQALLDPSNLKSAVQLATKLDDSNEEISLKTCAEIDWILKASWFVSNFLQHLIKKQDGKSNKEWNYPNF